MPPPREPKIADFDHWPCTCPARQLLHERGCSCGAWAAALRAHAGALKAHAVAKREGRRRLMDFFIRAPGRSVTFRSVCDDCDHPPHAPDACPHLQCYCGW